VDVIPVDTLRRILKGKDSLIALIILLVIYGTFLGILGIRTYEYFSGPVVSVAGEHVSVNLVHRWAAIYGSGESACVNVVYVGSGPTSRIIARSLPDDYYSRLVSIIKDSVKKRAALGEDYIENRDLGITYKFSDLIRMYRSAPCIFVRYVSEAPKVYVMVSWVTTDNLTADEIKRLFFGNVKITLSRFESPTVYVVYFVWYNGLVGVDFLEPFGMPDAFNRANIVLAGQSFIVNQSLIDFITEDLSKVDESKVYSGVIVLSEDGSLIFRAVKLGVTG